MTVTLCSNIMCPIYRVYNYMLILQGVWQIHGTLFSSYIQCRVHDYNQTPSIFVKNGKIKEERTAGFGVSFF